MLSASFFDGGDSSQLVDTLCGELDAIANGSFTDEELYLRDSESDNESIPDLTEAEAKELYDNIRWI